MKGCVSMLLSIATLMISFGVIITGASWAWGALKAMFSGKKEDE